MRRHITPSPPQGQGPSDPRGEALDRLRAAEWHGDLPGMRRALATLASLGVRPQIIRVATQQRQGGTA